jgi:TPR repeat protein
MFDRRLPLQMMCCLLFASFFPYAEPASAEPTECDLLAASPYDVSRPRNVPGVPYASLDARKAIKACIQAIQANHMDARTVFQLGRAFAASGKEGKRAMQLYLLAAKAGHVLSLSNIGTLYVIGDGVQADLATAIKWFRKAAGKGEVFAQMRLGDFYWDGVAVKKDYVKAFSWYRKAAAQGQQEAKDWLEDRQHEIDDGDYSEIVLATAVGWLVQAMG